MVENGPISGVIELPRGRYRGRLDDKGRFKLPADFAHFFRNLPENKLFVTSLDRRIAQIYPIALWRENEKFFESYCQDPEAAANISFNANDLGADAELDNQGRITLNPDLRRELDLDGQELHLIASQGRVDVLTEALYQEQKRRSIEKAGEDLKLLRKAGLR